MNGRRLAGGLCLVATFVAGMFAGTKWLEPDSVRAAAHAQQPAPGNDHWLIDESNGRRDQLERHLRGLDVAMLEIGHRFNEMHFAGRDRNWPYAQYQIEKIELALQLALERRPQRAKSAKPFLEETIPFIKQSIAAAADGGGAAAYAKAMDRLRTDCMKCHVAENVPHFRVEFP